MDIVKKFLKEQLETGGVSDETAAELACFFKGKNKPGAKKKVLRDVEACIWYSIAVDHEKYKSNLAFSALASRLKTDERNARRIEKKGRSVNQAVFVVKVKNGYMAVSIPSDFQRHIVQSVLNGKKTSFDAIAADFHGEKQGSLFFFKKSDF